MNGDKFVSSFILFFLVSVFLKIGFFFTFFFHSFSNKKIKNKRKRFVNAHDWLLRLWEILVFFFFTTTSVLGCSNSEYQKRISFLTTILPSFPLSYFLLSKCSKKKTIFCFHISIIYAEFSKPPLLGNNFYF